MKHSIQRVLSSSAARTVQSDRQLLWIAAVVESLTGLALSLAPGGAVALLLGTKPDTVGLKVSRVLGAALLALGVSCWGARTDSGGAARTGTLRAITLYNVGAGLLLVTFAATGRARGLVAGSVGVFHLGLAAGFAAAHWPGAATMDGQSAEEAPQPS